MNTKITTLSLVLITCFSRAQTVSDFESFTLAANSAYSSTVSTPFQTTSAIFEYNWDSSFGGFWAGGCAYTNKQDSSTGTFANLYGVKAFTGYSNTANYVVAQKGAVIKLKAPYDKVEGMYITNTTYTYKAIKNGNSFSRKFGDTLGTKSGTTIPQGYFPDYFKVTAKGFKNGTMKPDSAVFFLADYQFSNNTQDYIVNTWQWFNTSALGSVDSVTFFMYSSDNGTYGMNTPAFFAFDNFTASAPNLVAINSVNAKMAWTAYPNPFQNTIKINGIKNEEHLQLVMHNVSGAEVLKKTLSNLDNELNTDQVSPGIYFLEINSGNEKRIIKLVKY